MISPEIERILNRKVGKNEDPAVFEMERRKALLAKVQMLDSTRYSEARLLDKTDPAFRYLWVYNDVKRIFDMEQMYAQVVRADNDPTVESPHKRGDGTHVRGDLILMRMHKDIAEAWDATREIRAAQALDGYRGSMKTWGEDNGVPVFDAK